MFYSKHHTEKNSYAENINTVNNDWHMNLLFIQVIRSCMLGFLYEHYTDTKLNELFY